MACLGLRPTLTQGMVLPCASSRLSSPRWFACRAGGKGFGSSDTAQGAEAAPAPSQTVDSVDALESRLKAGKSATRRAGKVLAKVKVESAIVDAVTGKTEPSEAEKYEGYALLFLAFLFVNILLFGLILAGSGFLPEEWDQFAEKVVYPNYSYLVLSFVAGSSAYGLFKTGMLPGQKKMVE